HRKNPSVGAGVGSAGRAIGGTVLADRRVLRDLALLDLPRIGLVPSDRRGIRGLGHGVVFREIVGPRPIACANPVLARSGVTGGHATGLAIARVMAIIAGQAHWVG